MPKDDLYLPLEVGVDFHGKKTSFQSDNDGNNISKKNDGYSELTGMYWAWKNLKADYKGLVHYRRYFSMAKCRLGKPEKRLQKVLTKQQAENLLKGVDVILPRKRNYLIEDLYDHYAHTMHKEPLDLTCEIIKEKYPKYYDEFLKLHERKTAHMFNMMVMKEEIFDEYSEWLFDILFELEKRAKKIDLKYEGFHARFYGRISELLLDVFVRTNNIEYVEVPVISIEPVNWIKKGGGFLKAKFFGKKYEESF
ncbi:DUF4422 domain-containing protein [Candidatus Saccharibacteria bacterium]|nr:DUF4422 domain-containing protein [Candidatus Saccharibacteria bacterium]